MATSGLEAAIIGGFSLIGTLLWYYKPGSVSIARAALHGVLSLGLCTLLLHLYNRWRHARASSARGHYDEVQAGSNESLKQQREKTQDQFKQQATSYNERILQPRLEAKQKKREEEFRRFDGPAWKGARHKLGGDESGIPAPQGEGSRTAAHHRTLPPEPIPPPPPPPKPKTVITLPPEPASTAADVITLELRTPLGRCHRRRFLLDDTIQVALDYMTTVGYHRKLYCLCSSYPRAVLSADPTATLRHLGIRSNTALMVEEIVSDDE